MSRALFIHRRFRHPPASAEPIGTSTMPTSAPAGWTRIYSEDFLTPSALGSFVNNPTDDWFLDSSNAYANIIRSYPDGWDTTYGYSLNYASKTVDVLGSYQDAAGVFRMHAHTEVINGVQKSLTASLYPVIKPTAQTNNDKVSQIYGRYSCRFRTVGGFPSSGSRYGTAFFLWPANDVWAEGEVDFPEMGWGDVIRGFIHEIGNPQNNADIITTSTATDSDWHTAVIEWYPTALCLYLNGVMIKKTTSNVPQTPFRWGFQSGGHDGTPAVSVSGDLLVDWVTVESYNGAPVPI